MALDWLPIYPARIATVVLLGASFQPHYAGSGFPVPSVASWHPTYPDRIERKVQHPSQKPALFQAGRVAIPDATVPPLAWKAQYPDRLDRKRLPVADQPSVFAVPFSRATQLTQSPVYPDQIVRPKIHASAQLWSFFKLEGPPIFLSWKGEQPSRIDPKPGLTAAQQKAYFFHPRPVPAPDPPGLGYAVASYPGQIPPKVSLLTARQQAFAFYPVPIPNAPPPTELTWAPIYPVLLYRLERPRTVSALVTVPVVATPGDLKWLPTYPTRFNRPARTVQAVVAPFQVSAVLDVPISQAWRATYPDQIHRVPITNSYVGFDPLSIASLLPFIPSCVAVYDETVATAAITPEYVTHAAITDEVVTIAGIDPEEFCP